MSGEVSVDLFGRSEEQMQKTQLSLLSGVISSAMGILLSPQFLFQGNISPIGPVACIFYGVIRC